MTFFYRHKRKAIIVLLLFELFLLLIATEITLHVIDIGVINENNPGRKRHIVFREHSPDTVNHFNSEVGEVQGTAKRKFVLRIDSQGFIVPSGIHEYPDLKIVFLGGSTTECLLVEEESRFPYVVGRLLEAKGSKVNSYNAGVSGNHSMHSLNILINKILPLRPDIVVMMHNINDLSVLMYEGTYWNNHPNRRMIANDHIFNIYNGFFQFIKNSFKSIFPHITFSIIALKDRFGFGYDKDEWADYRKNIDTDDDYLQNIKIQFSRSLISFIEIARVYEIIPVLMTQARRPNIHCDGLSVFRNNAFDQLNQVIRDIGREMNILVIDLSEEMSNHEAYFYDSHHYTENGSLAVAKIIAQKLKPILEENITY